MNEFFENLPNNRIIENSTFVKFYYNGVAVGYPEGDVAFFSCREPMIARNAHDFTVAFVYTGQHVTVFTKQLLIE